MLTFTTQPNPHLLSGKMKAYSHIIIFICCVCGYTSVDIMPELKRSILNFGYRINFKYEGMLSHSFDRFYVVMKFVLKSSPIEFDSNCGYLDIDINRSRFPTEYIPNIRNFCKKIVPFIYFYKEQIDYYNQTAHEILSKIISLILPKFPKDRKKKRGIISLLATSFISLAYESISSYLHNRRQKALKFKVKIIHLYNTLFRQCLIESPLNATCNFPSQTISTVTFLCEGEPTPPISTPWGAYRP